MNSYQGVDGPGSMSSITERVWQVQKKRRTGEEFPDDGKRRERKPSKEDESIPETHVDIRGQGKESEEKLDPQKKNKRGSQRSSQGVSQIIDLLI